MHCVYVQHTYSRRPERVRRCIITSYSLDSSGMIFISSLHNSFCYRNCYLICLMRRLEWIGITFYLYFGLRSIGTVAKHMRLKQNEFFRHLNSISSVCSTDVHENGSGRIRYPLLICGQDHVDEVIDGLRTLHSSRYNLRHHIGVVWSFWPPGSAKCGNCRAFTTNKMIGKAIYLLDCVWQAE